MCRDVAHGGARCQRQDPIPGSPASGAERALRRAESVAATARDEANQEIDAALERLFTSVAEAVSPEERARALAGWMDRVGAAFARLCRALERVHARRLAALDARWAERLAGALAAVREARYAEERAALERLHVCELVLAEVELAARTPDWSDELWHSCQAADLETLGSELQAERDRQSSLERRAARGAPDPRVLSDMRSTQARVRCWSTTLERQCRTLAGLPRTREEADEAVARALADVNAARVATGLTDDERAYLANPILAATVEHGRSHPEERRGRAVRA